MLKVPSINRVDAGDVGVQQTATPAIRTPVDFGVAADSLVRLGGSIGAASDQLFRAGREIQSREERREAQEALTSLKKFGQDLQYGEQGYLKQQGADAVKGSEAVREAYEKERQRLLGGFTNQRSQELFGPTSEAEGLQYSQTHSAWVLKQQKVAENRADAADITINRDQWVAEPDPLGPVAQQHNAVRKNEIIASTLSMADRAAVHKPARRAFMIKKALTGVHHAVVVSLINQGRGVEAKTYLEQAVARGEVLAETATVLAAETRPAAILGVAQGVVDSVKLSHGGGTAKDRIDEVARLLKDQPEARKAAEQQMRLYNATLGRDRKETDRANRMDALEYVEDGGSLAEMPRHLLASAKEVRGFWASLQKMEASIASGRPRLRGDERALQAFSDANKVFRDDPIAFYETDWSENPDLHSADVRELVRMQGLMDKTTAKKISQNKKEAEKTARSSRIRSAISATIRSLELNKQKAARLELQTQNEVERLIAAGETLSDKQINDVAVGLYLRGEIRGSGLGGISQFNVRVGRAIKRRIPFTIENFMDEPEVKTILAETGLTEEQVQGLASRLVALGRGVTTDTVSRLHAIETAKNLTGTDEDFTPQGPGSVGSVTLTLRGKNGSPPSAYVAWAGENAALVNRTAEAMGIGPTRVRGLTRVIHAMARAGITNLSPEAVKKEYDAQVAAATQRRTKKIEEPIQKVKEIIANFKTRLEQFEGPEGDTVTGLKTIFGVTAVAKAALEKRHGRRFTSLQARDLILEENQTALRAKMRGYSSLPVLAQAAILDLTFNVGMGAAEFPELAQAVADGNVVEAMLNTLDTSLVKGKTLAGLGLRRASNYNLAVPVSAVKVKWVEQLEDRLNFLDAEGNVLKTQIAPRHPKSNLGRREVK